MEQTELQKANYLRPNQVEELRSEEKSCEKALSPENRSDSRLDRGAMTRQLQNIKGMLHNQSPPDVQDKTSFNRLSKDLEKKITEGMPSKEEMRKNPPGAVAKHLQWESKNKDHIRQWKNLQLILNKGSEDPDLANVEKFRPNVSTLNMDNAQISGQQFYFPPGDLPAQNVMSDEDREQMEGEKEALMVRIRAMNEEGLLSDEDRKFFNLEKPDVKSDKPEPPPKTLGTLHLNK